MKVDRLTRVNEMLRREIAEALFGVIHEGEFDLSAVTITHVVTSRDLRTARVFVSIRDHVEERPRFLRLLDRHRQRIQSRINAHLVLKYTPRLTFELDSSVEKGDKVLGLLFQMEQSGLLEPPATPRAPAAGTVVQEPPLPAEDQDL